MGAKERKLKTAQRMADEMVSQERAEAAEHDLRMHEFRIREEEERARALVARVGIRAALLGGLLATVGGAAAVLILRWIDPRPVVTVRCECRCGAQEKESLTINNQDTGDTQ